MASHNKNKRKTKKKNNASYRSSPYVRELCIKILEYNGQKRSFVPSEIVKVIKDGTLFKVNEVHNAIIRLPDNVQEILIKAVTEEYAKSLVNDGENIIERLLAKPQSLEEQIKKAKVRLKTSDKFKLQRLQQEPIFCFSDNKFSNILNSKRTLVPNLNIEHVFQDRVIQIQIQQCQNKGMLFAKTLTVQYLNYAQVCSPIKTSPSHISEILTGDNKYFNTFFSNYAFSLTSKLNPNNTEQEYNGLLKKKAAYDELFAIHPALIMPQIATDICTYLIPNGNINKSIMLSRYDSSDEYDHQNRFFKNKTHKRVIGDRANSPHFHFQNRDNALFCAKNFKHYGFCNAIDCDHLIQYLIELDNFKDNEISTESFGLPFLEAKLRNSKLRTNLMGKLSIFLKQLETSYIDFKIFKASLTSVFNNSELTAEDLLCLLIDYNDTEKNGIFDEVIDTLKVIKRLYALQKDKTLVASQPIICALKNLELDLAESVMQSMQSERTIELIEQEDKVKKYYYNPDALKKINSFNSLDKGGINLDQC